MAEHDDEHGHDDHGEHGGFSVGKWMDSHISGIVMPFGDMAEKLFEHTLVFSINGFFTKAAKICLVIITPIVVLEFLIRSI